LVLLISVVFVFSYAIFSYVNIIKIQNEVFLNIINQSTMQINLKLDDLESTLRPGKRYHSKKVHQQKQKELVPGSTEVHCPSGNYGFITKNRNSTLSPQAP